MSRTHSRNLGLRGAAIGPSLGFKILAFVLTHADSGTIFYHTPFVVRIFKLSRADPDMPNRSAVLKFFTETLWKKSNFGCFGLTEDKASMRGIERDTLILFTYETECLFLGRAAGPIVKKAGEAYVPLDMASMAPVAGWLSEFQEAARHANITDKELVHTQSWPGIDDDQFAREYFNYEGRQRVLFVRVGWMKHYRGPIPGDERPVGGGKYNKDKTGLEVCNFLPLKRRLYGYFQPQMRSNTTNLERIDRIGKDQPSLENVTIVWVATHPKHAQFIVGWWRKATLYREQGPKVTGRLKGFDRYRATAAVSDCVLVPEAERTMEIPKGENAFGQANVFYPLESSGARRASEWMFAARLHLEEYDRKHKPEETPQIRAKVAISELEGSEERHSGQGFRLSAADRKAIEDYGMARARAYYEGLDYDVEDVSRKRPYDLLCVKDGHELHVEVKATTTAGKKVFLTRREADLAASSTGNRALYIVHSIQLKNRVASGGKEVRHEPWVLDWDHAQPELYSYRPPDISHPR